MSNDLIREVSETGYDQRIKQSFSAALFGLLIFIAAFPLEIWNEGRAVKQRQALEEGAGEVLSVPTNPISPANTGKLIHVTGKATAVQPPVDTDIGISAPGLALYRKAEMLQWREIKETHEEKQLGGGSKTVTTWRYEIDWSEKFYDTAQFHDPHGHENPTRLPFLSAHFRAQKVVLGDYVLGPEITDEIRHQEPLAPRVGQLQPNLAASFQVYDDALVTSKVLGQPKIGDVRIRYFVIPEQTISIVGAQAGNGIGKYHTKNGSDVLLIESGERSADDMFVTAQEHNTTLTWVLRGIGFMMMWFGLSAALGWIGRLLDVIPWVGSLIETGIGIIAALLAAIFSLLTVALAWFVYRPWLSLTLFVGIVFCIFMIRQRNRMPPKQVRPRNLPPPGSFR